jgi:cell division protein FtsW
MILVIGKNKPDETAQNKNTLTEQVTSDKEEDTGFIASIFHRADTWKARINKFLNHEYIAPEDFDLDKDGQVGHANIAIASSNIVGKGPGNSNERDWLSQAFSDFIYAIIIEEMGIEGAALVALLYIFLLFRSGQIANRCENNFPAFLAMGIALLLVSQALFNMLVAVGLAPVTGQPLPLISKGGTSSIINCIYIGVILSISRSAKKKDTALQDAPQKALALA